MPQSAAFRYGAQVDKDTHPLLVRNARQHSQSGKQAGSFLKQNSQLSACTPRHLSQKNKKLHSHKNKCL